MKVVKLVTKIIRLLSVNYSYTRERTLLFLTDSQNITKQYHFRTKKFLSCYFNFSGMFYLEASNYNKECLIPRGCIS